MDAGKRALQTSDGELRYDHANLVLPMRTHALVRQAGLGQCWADVELPTFQAKADARIFVIGDAQGSPQPKSGQVAFGQVRAASGARCWADEGAACTAARGALHLRPSTSKPATAVGVGSLTPLIKKDRSMAFVATAPSPRPSHPLPPEQLPRVLAVLALLHVLVIIASNVLVQLPFQIGGVHTTWGAFTFPLVFVLTDLTVRLLGPAAARRVVARVMLPALAASYVVSVLFVDGRFAGWAGLATFNDFVFRIALASFAAYVVGQLTDIAVFARLRRLRAWWVAPAASTIVGGLIDTFVFFAAAFWRSPDAFMAEHWVEIAAVDYATKLAFSLLALLPLYGAALRALLRRLPTAPLTPQAV